MHPPDVRQKAKLLIAQGVNDCEIARRLDVPRTTVREWRRPHYVKRVDFEWEICPRCWAHTRPLRFTSPDYADLLGLYLGDGCISQHARTQQLRICFDAKYPQLITDADALLRRCFPQARTGRVSVHEGRMIVLYVYSSHLACLFPQHGPGKKHERSVKLEPWQQTHVDAAPFSFLRGLVRSDGCIFLNKTGPYVYESYDFANHSQDLLDLFGATCDAVGVEYRRYARHIRIYRRASVAKMLERVGRKN